MTLTERIAHLRTAAIVAGDDYKLKLRTGELRSLHDGLRAATDDMPGLVTAVRELRLAGVTLDDYVIAEAVSVANTVGELQRTLGTLRYDDPLDGPKAHARSVEAVVKRLRESVQRAWTAQINSDTALIDDELVEALHRGGADVEDLRQSLSTAASALFVLRNRAIPREGDMAKLIAAFAARQHCANRVRDLVPPAVAEVILSAQAATGVPLSHMTNEVLGELDRLGIRERFRVTLR